MPEVAIILILFRNTRLTSWWARPSEGPGSVAWPSPPPSWSGRPSNGYQWWQHHFNFVQEYTINQLVGAAFGAAGQRCMALTMARRGRGGQALNTRGGNHFDFVQEYTINQLVGAAFGAAGQRCMALTTAVVVGEARHWIPEVAEKAAKLKLSAGMHDTIFNVKGTLSRDEKFYL
jgi:hypothetical protein